MQVLKDKDHALQSVEGEIRELLFTTKPPAERAPEFCAGILEAGAASIAEITKLIEQLHASRNYLETQGERLRSMASQYVALSQTATDSVKIISESMSNWRKPDLAIAKIAPPLG